MYVPRSRYTARRVLRAAVVAAAALAVTVASAATASARTSSAAHAATAAAGCTNPVAPYLYLSWGQPQDPVAAMQSTGLTCFTLAFVLAEGGTSCAPMWDTDTPLDTGIWATAIARIRAAGGDVVVSSGGATSALALETRCATVAGLAAAYSKIIDSYRLTSFDVDLEGSALADYVVQDRVLKALKSVKSTHPATKLVLTVPSGQFGLHSEGRRLVTRAAVLGSPVGLWSIMPFDFGDSSTDTASAAQTASTGLHATLATAFPGRASVQLWRMQGISAMNGVSDTGERMTVADAGAVRSWASARGMGRLTFWALNRDRACDSTSTGSSCSGVPQPDYAFTRAFLGTATPPG